MYFSLFLLVSTLYSISSHCLLIRFAIIVPLRLQIALFSLIHTHSIKRKKKLARTHKRFSTDNRRTLCLIYWVVSCAFESSFCRIICLHFVKRNFLLLLECQGFISSLFFGSRRTIYIFFHEFSC